MYSNGKIRLILQLTDALWLHATPGEVGQTGPRDGTQKKVALSAAVEY